MTATETPTRKIRVNVGVYTHSDGKTYGAGQPAGPVIDCEEDLPSLYGREKFSYLEDHQVVQNRPIGDDGLATLDEKQLKGFAEIEGIDIADISDKADIVKRIRVHLYGLSDVA